MNNYEKINSELFRIMTMDVSAPYKQIQLSEIIARLLNDINNKMTTGGN